MLHTFPTPLAYHEYKKKQLDLFLDVWYQFGASENPFFATVRTIFHDVGAYDALLYHQKMILAAIETQNIELLDTFMIWRYRLYYARGIPLSYFSCEALLWIEGIRHTLHSIYHDEWENFYTYLITSHERYTQEALSTASPPLQSPPICEHLIEALLKKDHHEIDTIFDHYTLYAPTPLAFCDEILTPTLYRIGELWEQNKISIATEHYATAILLSGWQKLRPLPDLPTTQNPLALVLTPSDQLHTAGVDLVCDLLSHEKWRVATVRFDDTTNNIIEAVVTFRPQLIIVSISLGCYIPLITNFVKQLRSNHLLFDDSIAVGGSIFARSPDLRIEGVDFHGSTLTDLKKFLTNRNDLTI